MCSSALSVFSLGVLFFLFSMSECECVCAQSTGGLSLALSLVCAHTLPVYTLMNEDNFPILAIWPRWQLDRRK